jgi:flagellar basal-body rod modification protein FlgD
MATTNSTSSATSTQDIYAALNTKKTETTSAVDDQQNRFLKLLTTQLQNQDPMNPVDNAQTTSQLAQISTVSGVTQLNSTLEKLMSSYQSSESLQAANLIGRGVLVEGSGLTLSKSMAAGGIQLDGPADKVSVSILDANGIEVDRLDMGNLDAGIHEFAWDGTSTNGTVLADGNYTIKVSATQDGNKVVTHPLQLGKVNSVVTGGSSLQIDVSQIGRVAVSDIKLVV